LYLNVHVPTTKAKDPLPVMLFVHGGGWVGGDGTIDIYGPERLLDKDVVNMKLFELINVCVENIIWKKKLFFKLRII